MGDDEETEVYMNPNYVKEWEASRGVLARFDGYLNDLRKYGFTLITALLALSSFLLPYSSQTDPATGIVTTANFPDNIKFVVLLVNLIIIVAVAAIDRIYTVFLKAAATRARVLERALNLELTEIITHRYRSAKSGYVITVLYVFFMIMVLTLGIFVLGHDLNLLRFLYLFVLAAILAVLGILNYIRVAYPHGPIDYTLDRLQCSQGDTVAITLTNLGEDEIIIENGAIAYEIRDQVGEIAKSETVERIIKIGSRDSYTWLWKVQKDRMGKDLKGIYEVWRPTATQKPNRLPDELAEIYEKKLAETYSTEKAADLARKKSYIQLLEDKEDKETKKTVLVPLTRSIRVYEKPPKPPQTDADTKLEMIKKMLC